MLSMYILKVLNFRLWFDMPDIRGFQKVSNPGGSRNAEEVEVIPNVATPLVAHDHKSAKRVNSQA